MPYANRDLEELQGIVGYFVNMLPLRENIEDGLSFLELMRRVHANTIEAFSHAQVWELMGSCQYM